MILTYHKIHPFPETKWWVTPDAFYRQMVDLQNRQVVYLDEYDPHNPEHVVISFDGVYENVLQYAVPILKKFSYPFELFIIGKYIGKDNAFDAVEPLAHFAGEESLLKLVEAGGRLQWHTWSHEKLKEDALAEKIEQELIVPEHIRALCEEGFGWFAYPHGLVSDTYKLLASKRYRGALVVDHGSPEDPYGLPRLSVMENTRLSEEKISVVIPCYNYGDFLAEAIESVLYQTYPPDEIIVMDDASTDNSVEIASFYKPRVQVVKNPQNLGIVENFKKALNLVKGDYICLLGADNRFRSDYLEKCKVILDSDPEIGVAYTNITLFGDRAGINAAGKKDSQEHPLFPGFYIRRYPENPGYDIDVDNYIHGSSMYRKTAYDAVGGYRGNTGLRTEDHDLFSRFLKQGWKARLVKEPILEYRQHSPTQANRLHGMQVHNALLRSQLNQATKELNAYKRKYENFEEDVLIRARFFLFPPGSLRERSLAFLFRRIRKIRQMLLKVLGKS